jgi:hypothetical protein
MQHVTDTVKKNVQDAAYIAVGVGVLGAHDVRERVEPVIARIEDRVEPIIGEVEARIEPVLDQVLTTARAIAATGTAKAQAFLGKDEQAAKATTAA